MKNSRHTAFCSQATTSASAKFDTQNNSHDASLLTKDASDIQQKRVRNPKMEQEEIMYFRTPRNNSNQQGGKATGPGWKMLRRYFMISIIKSLATYS